MAQLAPRTAASPIAKGRRPQPRRPGNLHQLALYKLPPALRRACQARIACLVIPHFPLEVELLHRPELRGKPMVIGGGVNQPKTVLDCSPEAETWGVTVGMQLRQALARCHEAVFLEARPTVYADINDRVFHAGYSISPRVEIRQPGCLYADVGGLRQSEAELLAELVKQVSNPIGLFPRGAIASGKFPAYAAAVSSEHPRVVPAEQIADFVADLACSHLPVPFEMRSRLNAFGIYKLRDIARLPKGAMLAQFGRDGARAWELSVGLDTEFLRPVVPQVAISDQLDFDEPVSNVGALMEGLRALLTRLCGRLSASAQAARSIQLRASIGYGRVWEGRVPLKEPTSDFARMLAVARSVVERQEWTSAIEGIQVRLGGITNMTGRQLELFPMAKRGAHHRLEAAVRQLSLQYRRLPLYRLMDADSGSRIPERRFALATYLPDAAKPEVRAVNEPRPIQVSADADGAPVRVQYYGKWLDVAVVREEFRLCERWLYPPIFRRYFKVVLVNGRFTILFSESGCWCIAR